MAKKVKPENLSATISAELNRYSKEKSEEIADAVDTVAKEATSTLRRTSPRKTGSYQKGWRSKAVQDKAGRYVKVVHNKTDYQLTHLLEKGHNNKQTGRFTNAIVHISPVEEKAVKDITKKIEEILKR